MMHWWLQDELFLLHSWTHKNSCYLHNFCITLGWRSCYGRRKNLWGSTFQEDEHLDNGSWQKRNISLSGHGYLSPVNKLSFFSLNNSNETHGSLRVSKRKKIMKVEEGLVGKRKINVNGRILDSIIGVGMT